MAEHRIEGPSDPGVRGPGGGSAGLVERCRDTSWSHLTAVAASSRPRNGRATERQIAGGPARV